jgi:hypothetical protein
MGDTTARSRSFRPRARQGVVKRKPRRAELGLGVAEYDALLAAQGGGCAICGAAPQTERPRRAWTCRYCKTLHGVGLHAAEICTVCHQARPALRRLDVDHNHATGKVRGLLCARCNQALPSWLTPAWALAVAEYLGFEVETIYDTPEDGALWYVSRSPV